jgi:hypothetical protein
MLVVDTGKAVHAFSLIEILFSVCSRAFVLDRLVTLGLKFQLLSVTEENVCFCRG